MVREDLYITVPSFFRCPISLDVMKSPVSLCTGVTYDRSSIQKWLDNGNNTCPATMQVLQNKDIVPNHTLKRLIQIWSDSVNTLSDSSSSDSPPSLSKEQAQELVKEIERDDCSNQFDSLSKIICFASELEENRKFLARIDGFLSVTVNVLCNAGEELRVLERVIRILELILIDFEDKEKMSRLLSNSDFLSSILFVFQQGSLNSKIRSARVLELIAFDAESKLTIASNDAVLSELVNSMTSNSDSNLNDAVLSCLVSVTLPKRTRSKITKLGVVQKLTQKLGDPNSTVTIIEKSLKLLEMVSMCTEGRTEICDDPLCIPAVVQKLLKVSTASSEHAVVILWRVCHVFRDQRAEEAVTKSNGLTKILLLMQSNCSGHVREMSSDLLKIFRVNSKSCLSFYDTKTTHIMPF
ncbi:U-box domain [Dillenia turbinata]|uniref:U-box domain-containing protein n=1 Tax=Dillenia turbinata TaxID=194707 RepID=A0AAN8VAJ9_9MAGN